MLGSELIKLMSGSGGESTIILTDAFLDGVKNAQWTLGADGYTYLKTTAGAAAKGPAWLNPISGMNLFEVEATVLDGDTPPGTIGSWLNASTAPAWGWTSNPNPLDCHLSIQIRRVSDSIVVGSATITLLVEGLA